MSPQGSEEEYKRGRRSEGHDHNQDHSERRRYDGGRHDSHERESLLRRSSRSRSRSRDRHHLGGHEHYEHVRYRSSGYGRDPGRDYQRKSEEYRWGKGRNTRVNDDEFLDRRMKERDEIHVNIWERSPERPDSLLSERLSVFTSRLKKHGESEESGEQGKSTAVRALESDSDSDGWLEKEPELKVPDSVGKQEGGSREFGPNPAGAEMISDQIKVDNKLLTEAMMPGEGASYLQYVQQNKRIPRRGEVGMVADEIKRLEDAGYVMSGSRNKRMNAVRLRKEMQVYSAEAKRGLLEFKYKQKLQKESDTVSHFRTMLQERMETK